MPRDQSLSLTFDSNIHSLSPTTPNNPTLGQHHLHLFLNLYKRDPYLLYTFDGAKHTTGTVAPQHLAITTSLPSSFISSKRPKRHHMKRTLSHAPEIDTVLIFPADSVQHQMTSLTLATHMLLSIPVIYAPHMEWKIIRQPHTHLNTLHLILATLALKRYHPIWFTEAATLPHATPDASCATPHSLASVAPTSKTQPILPPAPPTTRTGTAAQLLLPSLLSLNPSKKRGIVTSHPLRQRSSKRYKHT